MRFLILSSFAYNAFALKLLSKESSYEKGESSLTGNGPHWHRKRQDKKKSAEENQLNEIVFLSELGSSYVDSGLFQNFAHYAKKYLNESISVVLDTSEPDLPEKVGKLDLPFKVHFLLPDFSLSPAKNYSSSLAEMGGGDTRPQQGGNSAKSADENQFMSEGFLALMKRRPKAVQMLLEQGKSVLLADMDTVWARNPFEEIAKHGHHDLYVIKDNFSKKKTRYCGCFQFYNPTKNAIEFVKAWDKDFTDAAEQGHAVNDQFHFNEVLKNKRDKGDLDWTVLPASEFPPGYLAFRKYGDATVWHANWMKGVDNKVKWFQEHGLWYKDDTESK